MRVRSEAIQLMRDAHVWRGDPAEEAGAAASDADAPEGLSDVRAAFDYATASGVAMAAGVTLPFTPAEYLEVKNEVSEDMSIDAIARISEFLRSKVPGLSEEKATYAANQMYRGGTTSIGAGLKTIYYEMMTPEQQAEWDS